MMAQLVAMASTSSVCGSNCAANAKSVSSASGGGSNKPEITGVLRCGQRPSKREIGCSSSSKGGEKEEVGRRNNNNEELMRRSTSLGNLNRTPIAGRYHGQGRAELFPLLTLICFLVFMSRTTRRANRMMQFCLANWILLFCSENISLALAFRVHVGEMLLQLQFL